MTGINSKDIDEKRIINQVLIEYGITFDNNEDFKQQIDNLKNIVYSLSKSEINIIKNNIDKEKLNELEKLISTIK